MRPTRGGGWGRGRYEMEEIVVTGIRGSLEKAFNVKREADGFVDAISAEDIGKLPDQNVAEALQRVPGVAIQRNRGEGNFVSIRGLGPEYVRATLNGRTITSGEVGREFDFDVLPSESISLLEVRKSPTASLEEGGIGGTINVHTARPIDLGSTATYLSARGVYSELASETNPRVSGSHNWVNDDATLGFVISAAYSDASIRAEEIGSFGWAANSNFDVTTDITNDGVADPDEDPIFPFSANPALTLDDRDRQTLNGAFQFRPDDTFEVNVDFLYSEFDVKFDRFQALELLAPIEVSKNEDGSVSVSDFTLVGNTVVAASHTGFNMTTVRREEDRSRETSIFGFNIARRVGPWTYTGDAYYTRAESDDFQRQAVFEATQTNPDDRNELAKFYEASYAYNGFIPVIERAADLTNPANYTTRNQARIVQTRADEESGHRFDVEREIFDSSVVTTIKFGLGYRSRTKEVASARATTNPGALGPIDGLYVTLSGSFAGGDSVGLTRLLFPDIDATHEYVYTQSEASQIPGAEPLNSFTVEEDVLSAYLQLDLEGSVGDTPYTGNVGLRFVDTHQTSSGFAATGLRITAVDGSMLSPDDNLTVGVVQSETGPVSFNNSYTNVLPSLNLAFELKDDLFLRLAASETVTRPTLNNLAPRLTINATQRSGSAGNPELDPFTATSFDLGVEWYFAGSSALYGTLFRKKIDDLVVQVTQIETIGEVTFERGLTRPRNSDSADVDGLELGYTHAYQSGFGVATNVTYTDSSAEFDSASITDEVFTLEGLSEISYNIAVFYEQGPWQARMAYNYRDEFVRQTVANWGGTIFRNDYAQLDASVSYTITTNYTVFVEGINITDSETEEFFNVEERPIGFGVVGPRYSIGFRGSF